MYYKSIAREVKKSYKYNHIIHQNTKNTKSESTIFQREQFDNFPECIIDKGFDKGFKLYYLILHYDKRNLYMVSLPSVTIRIN